MIPEWVRYLILALVLLIIVACASPSHAWDMGHGLSNEKVCEAIYKTEGNTYARTKELSLRGCERIITNLNLSWRNDQKNDIPFLDYVAEHWCPVRGRHPVECLYWLSTVKWFLYQGDSI